MLKPEVLGELEQIGRNIQPTQFVRIALSQLRRNPKLLDCSQASFLNSLLRLAAVGLDCDGQQASLVPYKGECTLVIGYPGYITLAYRHPRIVKLEAHLLYPGETFEPGFGTMAGPVHTVLIERDARDEPYGAYAVAWVRSETGDTLAPLVDYMTIEEIDAIRSRAPSYSKPDGAHQQHPNEMRRKTVLRRLCKYLPRTPEMNRAIETDEVIEPTANADYEKSTAEIEQELLAPSAPAPEPPPGVGPVAPVPADSKSLQPPTAVGQPVPLEAYLGPMPQLLPPQVPAAAPVKPVATAPVPPQATAAAPASLAERRERMFAAFAVLGVTPFQVCSFLKRDYRDDITEDDLGLLGSTWGRINRREVTATEIFGPPPPAWTAAEANAQR